jgi:predicted AAA+ superfamily ATPase
MRESERRTYLLEHNPWWRGPGWIDRDPDLADARRNALATYDQRPLDAMVVGSLYLLLGPRRAGKSVAMKREIAAILDSGVDPRAITFCPCENLVPQDLRRMVKIAIDLGGSYDGDRYWLFDEITYVRDWVTTLKQLRDQTELRQGTVVATGSSAAKLREARGDLGGREGPDGGVRLLLPMGFRDFTRELYPELAASLPDQVLALGDLQSDLAKSYYQPLEVHLDEAATAWERYLTVGGFPGAVADVKAHVDVQDVTLRGLWNIFTGDVLRVGAMSDRDVKALTGKLVAGIGSPLSIANITEDLDIGSRNTVKDRVDRLCSSFYMWRASITNDGRMPVAGGTDKLYPIDPLVARLPAWRDKAIQPPDISQLNEQQLGVSLLRVIGDGDLPAVLDEAALLVRRNRTSGAEIDFVGPLLPVPIESKYVSQGWKREKKGVEDVYGKGVVATRDILDMNGKIWATPSCLLAWAIGA